MLIINNYEIVLESQKYIENHLEEKLLVSEIANAFGYSEAYFSRMFSKYVGISVMEYVKKRRLIRAAEEIVLGIKIIDAAVKYSYDSHSGFTKAFKKEFGYTPSLLSAMKMQISDLTGGSSMSKLLIRQNDEHVNKEELFQILLKSIKCNPNYINEGIINEAYEIAGKAYEGLKRYSGEEYIIHPLNVAIILADMGAGENAILAGLMCDIMKKTSIDKKMLKEKFANDVIDIIKGVSDFNILDELTDDDVILVKLAERLHNMRTLRFMDEEKWRIKAKETLEIYMPIARKFGYDALTEELNKLALEYT